MQAMHGWNRKIGWNMKQEVWQLFYIIDLYYWLFPAIIIIVYCCTVAAMQKLWQENSSGQIRNRKGSGAQIDKSTAIDLSAPCQNRSVDVLGQRARRLPFLKEIFTKHLHLCTIYDVYRNAFVSETIDLNHVYISNVWESIFSCLNVSFLRVLFLRVLLDIYIYICLFFAALKKLMSESFHVWESMFSCLKFHS